MNSTHWTERSDKDFLFRIAFDFVSQLEDRMNELDLTQKQLAQALDVSEGYVSQILNNPGNMTLEKMIRCARALGMKISVLAYDDADPENNRGPVSSDVIRACWEMSGKPLDMWAINDLRMANQASTGEHMGSGAGAGARSLVNVVYFDAAEATTEPLLTSLHNLYGGVSWQNHPKSSSLTTN